MCYYQPSLTQYDPLPYQIFSLQDLDDSAGHTEQFSILKGKKGQRFTMLIIKVKDKETKGAPQYICKAKKQTHSNISGCNLTSTAILKAI